MTIEMKIFLTLSAFLFGCVYSDPITQDDVLNICELPGIPMYCNCDGSYQDEAAYVTCYMSSNVSEHDPHWQGFRKQKNIESLVFISRENTYLTYVPNRILRFLPKMHHLALSEAYLGFLGYFTFANLSAIRTITAERNGITGIENRAFAHLPLLVKLTLSENRISEIPAEPFYDCPKLEELFLERNEIQKIHDGAFSDLHHLKELDLFHNHLKHLTPKTLTGLKSLTRLDVSRNFLTTLKDHTFRGTPRLQSLDLSHNHLSDISDHAFDGLPHLRILRIKDNRLVKLSDDIFLGSPKIISLTMTDNSLTTFQENLFQTLHSRNDNQFAIYLKDNAFECHCDMLWVGDYAKRNVNIIFLNELNSLKCKTSDMDQSETQIASLTADDLNCKDKPKVHHNKHHEESPSKKSHEHHHNVMPSTQITTTISTTPITTAISKNTFATKSIEASLKEKHAFDEEYRDDIEEERIEDVKHPKLERKQILVSDEPKNIELAESEEDIEKAKSRVPYKKNYDRQTNSSTISSAVMSFILLSALGLIWANK